MPAMNTSAAPPDSDPIMERLEDQLAWYDRKSMANQQAYRRIKIAEILAAAIIPFLAGLRLPHISIVVLITVLEGLLHLKPVPAELDQLPLNLRSLEA